VGLLIHGGIIALMLPTNYVRALLIALIALAIAVLIGLVIFGIFLAVSLALR
jgi:hypothetical protein